jgi:hypothetical protein
MLAIVGLLGLFALLSWLAASTKSAVYDEALHLGSSVAIKQLGDYRVDSEDPALFKHWLAILQPPRPVPTEAFWSTIGHEAPSQWAWGTLAVFNQPPADAMAEIDRGRMAMLAMGVALGALIAIWAWQLAGPPAGVIAAALFALDPNFLAHSFLAKNDVAAALGFAATAFALWNVGRRVTIVGVVGLCLAVGFTLTVKFSGVLLVAIVPIALISRAMTPDPWRFAERPKKLLLAAGIAVACAFAALLTIWSAYGFRYAPSPDPAYVLDVAQQSNDGFPLRLIDRAKLLPQSYTFGLAYTLHSAEHRLGYLFGNTSSTGWWYYFPVAMAVKTPLATIAMLIAAIALLAKSARSRLRKHAWLAICLALPAGVYLIMAMRSSLNLGIRHMLPVYPLAFVAIAVVLAKHRRTAMVLLVLLAIESFAVFPNYLAYFNVAVGGSRGGFKILSDSNLDWGQDLKGLADWQAAHPGKKLYLSYFGTADPNSYGVDYTNVGAGYAFNPQRSSTDAPGVVAVSATHLQGLYVANDLKPFYEKLRQQSPIDVIGGSIYLYNWPGNMTGHANPDIVSPLNNKDSK